MSTTTQIVTKTHSQVVSDAATLRKLLVAHDRSLQQIVLIDEYITRLTRQAILCMKLGKKGQALRLMNRKSTALGIKHAYRSFRIRKWYQVQQQVTSIIRALQSHAPSRAPPTVEVSGEVEGEQIQMVAKTLMVVDTNFSRAD